MAIIIGISFIMIFFYSQQFTTISLFTLQRNYNYKTYPIKTEEEETSILLVAEYFAAIGSSRNSFSADLTNIRTRISDGRIQFHRDVISVFSANCVTCAFHSLCLSCIWKYAANPQQPSQKLWWHAIDLLLKNITWHVLEIKLTN